jgi:hypothetical protein
VWLTAAHVPGKENIAAEEESWVFKEELEWALKDEIFQQICQRFGTPTVDLFASRLNKKVDRFYSWKSDPEAEVIDSFTVSWEQEAIYAFPPFCLIGRTIQKIIAENVSGVLVVPKWPTKSWYSMLRKITQCDPFVFPILNDTLCLPSRKTRQPHPLAGRTLLMACYICGKNY